MKCKTIHNIGGVEVPMGSKDTVYTRIRMPGRCSVISCLFTKAITHADVSAAFTGRERRLNNRTTRAEGSLLFHNLNLYSLISVTIRECIKYISV